MASGQQLTRRSFLTTTLSAASASAIGSLPVAASDEWSTAGQNQLNHRYMTTTQLAGDGATEQWFLSSGTSPTSEVVVADDEVYFSDASGAAYRVTQAGGTRTYQQAITTTANNQQLQTATPAVDKPSLYIGDPTGGIYAVDVESGDTIWEVTTNAPIRAPLRIGEYVYAGDDDGIVRALEPDSGDIAWRFEASSRVRAAPAIDNQRIYIAAHNGAVHALNTRTGASNRIFVAQGDIVAAPLVVGSRVIVATTTGVVKAVVPENGANEWRQELGEPIRATPATDGDTLLLATVPGTVVALDITTGQEQWRTDISGSIETGIVATDRTVCVGTDAGTIVTLGREQRTPIWTFDADAPVITPLSAANGNLYFGTQDAGITAITSTTSPIYTVRSTLDTTIDRVSAAATGSAGKALFGAGGAGTLATLAYAGWRRIKTDDVSHPTSQISNTNVTGSADSIASEPSNERTATIPSETFAYEDFERTRQIGSGGSADVYKAELTTDSSRYPVALKLPRVSSDETVDTASVVDMIEEAEVWDEIDDHHRIVSVYDWGSEPLPWIAMEYMAGGTLDDQRDRMSQTEIFTELEGLCEGLHHAHRSGITHTDIKPGNILFTADAPDGYGKLTDWGLANVLLDHSMSVHGLTPEYSAPEQLRPETYGGTDDRTDIYQLGVVAYELLTDALPFEGSSHGERITATLQEDPIPPSAVTSEIPASLDEVLLTALAKDKDKRYETALHFRDDLRRVYHADIA